MPVFICEKCDEAIVLLGEPSEVTCDCGALMCRLDDEPQAVAIEIPVGGGA